MGNNGIFVGMITAIVICGQLFHPYEKEYQAQTSGFCSAKCFRIIEPHLCGHDSLLWVFLVRYTVGLTSYGNIFDLVSNVVAKCLCSLDQSMVPHFFFHAFMNLCWFFGIHPAPILSVYIPVLMSAGTANTESLSGWNSICSELPFWPSLCSMVFAISEVRVRLFHWPCPCTLPSQNASRP